MIDANHPLNTWTADLEQAALREGWGLFTATDGPVIQVQRIDDQDNLPPGATFLPSDDAALAMVRCGTSEHHRIARAIIRDHCPEEWENMQRAYTVLVK